ncbi:HAD hydrolase-like protein [Rothia nasimurium]|uniref:HAD hydrolase-like protein n=1 Tax=Rothia nasimurium TaxID=85336 RepID=UPI001F45254F|nr:HAD hydrolase-like protein [Rothia nasimurium]
MHPVGNGKYDCIYDDYRFPPIFYDRYYIFDNQNIESYFDIRLNFYRSKTKFYRDQKSGAVFYKNEDYEKWNRNKQYKKNSLGEVASCFYETKKSLKYFLGDSLNNTVFLAIPSNDKAFINLPQVLAHNLSIEAKTSQSVYLGRSEVYSHPLHSKKIKRSVEDIKNKFILVDKNTNSTPASDWHLRFERIVILDDVVTSGSSMKAVSSLLMECGVPLEKIVCFAFWRFLNAAGSLGEATVKYYNDTYNNPITGIIWDFDGTIANTNDRSRDESLEEAFIKRDWSLFYRIINSKQLLHPIFEGIDESFKIANNRKVPYIVLTNRKKAVKLLLHQNLLRDLIFPQKDIDLGYNIVNYYTEEVNPPWRNFKSSEFIVGAIKHGEFWASKPSPLPVLEAVKKLCALRPQHRIIGIGDTLTDIIAYNTAGIESVLVNWGFPYRRSLSDQFFINYPIAKPNHIFNSTYELNSFLRANEKY